jgi:apolipoprotein N-acyltransferase
VAFENEKWRSQSERDQFEAPHVHVGIGLLAAAATAVLVWFGSGLNPWWPLMWFAPLPVLVYAERSRWWSAGLAAWLGWFCGGLNMWHYFRDVLTTPLAAVFLAGPALVFAAAVLLFRALLRLGAVWSALLGFPAAWVTVEFLLNLTSVHGTAGSLSYTQLGFLPFLQVASITGPWGMSFLLMLFPAALAIGAYLWRRSPRVALRAVVVGLGVILLALLFGAVRLMIPVPGPRVRVGLIASDLPANMGIADAGAESARLFVGYAGAAEELAARGAQVIVMPEKLGVSVDPETKLTDAFFQSLADKTKSEIVVGMVRVAKPLLYNEARIYAPGASPVYYDKQHMLPPFESQLTPGKAMTLLSKPSGTWGVMICKDLDFTRLSRRYGVAGAGLLLVPAWDFVVDRTWHGHMAVMRGVESGFSIARAAKQGFLTVSDDRGRIVAEDDSDSAPFATLLADVPVIHQRTVYLLLGDWFAWVAIAMLVIIGVQLWRLRKRMAAEENILPGTVGKV